MARHPVVWIDVERCTGCGACANACPVGAITLLDDKAHVDEEMCTGCEACLEVCPETAIHPVIAGELIQAGEKDVLTRSPDHAPAVQRPHPLVETAAPALAVAGAGLLAKATRALVRGVANWLTRPLERTDATGNQTDRMPTQPRAGRSNGRGRRRRRQRRGG